MVSAIHQPESAIDIHMNPPSWTTLPSPPDSSPLVCHKSPALGSLHHTANSKKKHMYPSVHYSYVHSFKKKSMDFFHSFHSVYFLALTIGEGNGTPLQYSCLENPWTEEPGRLQSMGSIRVVNDWATSLSLFTFMHWRRKWQPTPVFFPEESQGRGSLVGCHLWGHTESDTTEAT